MFAQRLPVVVLCLVAITAIAVAGTPRVAESKNGGFWSDEATYHSQAYSLAYDADLRYDRADLERVYAAGYTGGPSGIFLVRNPDDEHAAIRFTEISEADQDLVVYTVFSRYFEAEGLSDDLALEV